MSPKEILNIWADACEKSGITWYLFRETLLCAQGYQTFPAELKSVQVAVLAQEFQHVVTCINQYLPKDWKVETYFFTTKKKTLTLQMEEGQLEIYLLYPEEERTEEIASKIDSLRESVHIKTKLLSALKMNRKICQKAYKKLCTLLDGTTIVGETYYDVLLREPVPVSTPIRPDKKCSLMVEGVEYPVMEDYETYLINVFGDYKNGLFDDIGCGLLQEEKEALFAHQQRCVEALSFIQSLSEEFGLRYYLIAGSVLGAVRHGGFIPWDDDIDIGIRIEDREYFEKIVKEELPKRLPEGFSLMQSGVNNPYPRMFSKICYDGQCCIDLWPLVPTYTKGIRAEVTWYLAKFLTKAHYNKIGAKNNQFAKLVNIFCCFMTDRMVIGLAKHNENKYKKRITPAYINIYSIYTREKETMLRSWLDDEAVANFAGISVPVVGCTDAYLRHMYGDYMALPVPWKRTHRHVDRFS